MRILAPGWIEFSSLKHKDFRKGDKNIWFGEPWATLNKALQRKNEYVLCVTDLLRQIPKYENSCWPKGPCSWTVWLTVAKTRRLEKHKNRAIECFPSIACQAPRLGASGISWARGCLLYLIAAHTLLLHKLVQSLLKWCEYLASTTLHGGGLRL